MIRAAAMLMSHIGFAEKAKELEMALDICGQYEKKLVITGRPTGATGKAFTDYILEWLARPNLQAAWEGYVKA
jgi:hypothetical protein